MGLKFQNMLNFLLFHRKKSIYFLLKYSYRRPLDSAARDGRSTLAPTPSATVLPVNYTPLFISHFADGAVPHRRQMLPPVPGYIPVYIQHGDMPPDPYEFWIFQIASKNLHPGVSSAIYIPSTTMEVTDQPEPLRGISDSPTHDASNSEASSPSAGKGDTLSNGIPEASNICVSCGNTISEN